MSFLGPAALLLGSLAIPLRLQADEAAFSGTPPSVAIGSRIRFRAPTVVQGRVQGTVVDQDATSLTIRFHDVPQLVPRAAITEIDAYAGSRREWRRGLIVGAVSGAAAGLGGLQVRPECPETTGGACFTSRGASAAFFAVYWALVGGGVGALFKSDTWTRLPLDHVRVGLTPTRGGGIGISLSASF